MYEPNSQIVLELIHVALVKNALGTSVNNSVNVCNKDTAQMGTNVRIRILKYRTVRYNSVCIRKVLRCSMASRGSSFALRANAKFLPYFDVALHAALPPYV
jgi:hypothetical protein